MNCIDAGHIYSLDAFDGTLPQLLVFMKREGEGYPLNVGSYPGTNCQEVLRVLIDRVKYLQRQIPCPENVAIISSLRSALRGFEIRAAIRHGRMIPDTSGAIEELATCSTCGHIGCDGKHHERQV